MSIFQSSFSGNPLFFLYSLYLCLKIYLLYLFLHVLYWLLYVFLYFSFCYSRQKYSFLKVLFAFRVDYYKNLFKHKGFYPLQKSLIGWEGADFFKRERCSNRLKVNGEIDCWSPVLEFKIISGLKAFLWRKIIILLELIPKLNNHFFETRFWDNQSSY